MTSLDPTLAEHAARLLTGTDLSPADALATASGARRAPGTVAAAMRDGWASGDLAPITAPAEPTGDPS